MLFLFWGNFYNASGLCGFSQTGTQEWQPVVKHLPTHPHKQSGLNKLGLPPHPPAPAVSIFIHRRPLGRQLEATLAWEHRWKNQGSIRWLKDVNDSGVIFTVIWWRRLGTLKVTFLLKDNILHENRIVFQSAKDEMSFTRQTEIQRRQVTCSR